ncbi:ParB N-terminal domain-containing protein [Alteromonas sp. Cnat2-8]|uniref:ParB/RepB/Spo0J family partition protein n=1 Tax=Alteromonas sp. Cnat2-8 TaxID=2917728 RepID=UPI001EF56F22|nr:ParB N-terminal domain-containing protein [Alteromonas sp. Cnat2-8]MCG7655794.1 ParB N-terminal domain-containing protein [Alteromonas sp. Cnat2-8]
MNSPKKARRRTVGKVNSQEDLINQFESGEGVSKKSQQMLDDLKARDKSKESEVHDDPIFKTSSEIDRVLVDYIQPQSDNSRYLPVTFAQKSDAESIAALDNCVVCEKGLLENRLSKDNPRYDAVNLEIEEIKDLAETLKHSELVHPISVWRKNMTDYPIVAGHRRFYAIRFLYGGLIKVKVKIYAEKPRNLNVLRHIENFSRSDLTPPDALNSYAKAVRELESLEAAKMRTERTSLVTSYLGISRPSYYRYDKLYEHFDIVYKLLENKVVTSLIALYEEIKKAEKHNEVERYLNRLAEIGKFKKYIPSDISKKPGRAKQYITMPKVKVSQTSAIRRLLTEDVTKLDIGIDWENVNFDDAAALEKVLKSLLISLSK